MTNQLPQQNSVDRCANCGAAGLQTVCKDKLFGQGANAVIIEALPIRHCTTCNESYYDPEISQRIDDLLMHPEQQRVTRQIAVISLAA